SDEGMAEALFQEGRAASIINGPWAYAGYGAAGVNYGIAPSPRNEGSGHDCAPMVATSGYAINSNVPEDKLPHIVRLIRYLTSADMQMSMVRDVETIPAPDALRTAPEVTGTERLQRMMDQVDRGRPMPASG